MMREIIIDSNQLEDVEGMTPEYPYTMHRDYFADSIVPWHWHEEVEFGYVEDGEIEVLTTGGNYIFQKHEAYFCNTNVLAAMRAAGREKKGVLVCHMFHPVFLGGHFKSIFETKYMEPLLKNKNMEFLELRGRNENQRQILSLLRKAAVLWEHPDMEFQTRNLFSEIWLLMVAEAQEQEKDSKPVRRAGQERIQTMMTYIHQHYAEKITLEEIAQTASVGERECIRCFRNSIGKTPFEYLFEYRIRAAEKLLRSTDLSVTEIALNTGFGTSAYLGKMYRQCRGMTPLEYRKKAKKTTGKTFQQL